MNVPLPRVPWFRIGLAIALAFGWAALVRAAPPPWSVPPLPTTPGTSITLPTTNGTLLSKASPDECFNGVGVNYPSGPPCSTGKPKVNQAYVWGLAKDGNNLWFGTMANTQCLVEGAYLGITAPNETASAVCEFGSSQAVRLGTSGPPLANPGDLPAKIGDIRPPHIYVYNIATNTVSEKSVGPALPALNTTLGLRAAGTLNDVVFLAGPALPSGLNMFAFRASTGTFIGYKNFPKYTNIRKFAVIAGVLYAGVGGTTASLGTTSTGRVLRWAGDLTSPPAFPNLFNFIEVGNTDSMVSEIEGHEGRIFATTWPDSELAPSTPKVAGLFMSPLIPGGGLVSATDWTKVWSVTDYEPDAVTAATYGGGALASFGGYLYWGTMHVPLLSTAAHATVYPGSAPSSSDIPAYLTWLLNSERAISIFRGQNFATSPALGVVYGYTTMPVCVPASATTCSWQTAPNKMSPPLWGGAGFDNPFNNYTWTMAVYDNRLWVGTMDWSWLLADGIGGVPPPPNLNLSARGADLWYFPNTSSPAVAESISGVGNPSSYGIRNMIATGTDLFLGMANPMNLLTDPTAGPLGGWELIDLKARTPNTPAGSNVTVPLAGGATVTFCNVASAGYTGSVAIPGGSVPFSVPGGTLQELLLLGSTADWRTGCTGNLVFVPIPNLPAGSRMMALVWDPASGGLVWRDVTTSISGTGISGQINAQYRGVIAIVSPAELTPVPALSAWTQWALAAIVAGIGAFVLRSRRRQRAT